MNQAKELQKNWLLINNIVFIKKQKRHVFLLLLFFSLISKAQIANYVNNGSFEDRYNCSFPTNLEKAKYWRSIDSSSNGGTYFSKCPGINNVPFAGVRYQQPRSYDSYIVCTYFCQPPSCTSINNRGYQRNRLKQTLQSGKTYCVKFYVNVTNPSTYGMDSFGAYFGDNTLDTITKTTIPLTYLIPQVQNPLNNMVTDTLGWSLITGTFVATGNEKHMVIGNFKSDANTNKVLINSTNLPAVFTDVSIDDVSCIDIDLPAYAGPDIWGIPTNTVYIGRPQDIGIDEACMWYHLPNVTTAIDTVAGITVTVAATTQTYMVKQDICGNIKWDTVIVYASGTGLNEGEYIKNNISIYPNPASDVLNIEFNHIQDANFKTVLIYNTLGELIHEEELLLKNSVASFHTNELPNGVYYLFLKSDRSINVSKRFVVTKQ